MKDFIKVAASKQSLSMRKLVQGHGTNDAWFHTCPRINGKRVFYKPYQTWSHMLRRCYDSKLHEKYPTYIGCIVCDEWLTFSSFEKWMLTQDWQGIALDKDIIKQGNKVYCPEYCRFISQALNSLLTANNAVRGLYPLGVHWHKARKKYIAEVNIGGKKKHLGLFKTVPEAKSAYDKAKYAEIHRHAMMQSDPAIREGLLNWVIE